MLQLVNLTPFKTAHTILLDHEGNHLWTIIVKATFIVPERGDPEPHPNQEPVCLAPVFYGEPGKSSLKYESEIVAWHPGTDVVVNGEARVPDGNTAQSLEIEIKTGQLSKKLWVFGNRYWDRGLLSLRISTPEPFDSMPIRFENAFGGTISNALNETEDTYQYNPIGKGYVLQAGRVSGTPLPNIEYPEQCITSWKTQPYPASLGAIPGFWPQRSVYAGTYDEEWKRYQAPLWPEDLNHQFFITIPPDQHIDEPLKGGELVSLYNLTPDSFWAFRLPRLYFVIETHIRNELIRQFIQLDRLIIEPDERKFFMVWRSVLNCGNNARGIKKTVVRTKRVIR